MRCLFYISTIYGFFLSSLGGEYTGQLRQQQHKDWGGSCAIKRPQKAIFFLPISVVSHRAKQGGMEAAYSRVYLLYIHTSKYPHGLKQWNLFLDLIPLKSNSTCISFLPFFGFDPTLLIHRMYSCCTARV